MAREVLESELGDENEDKAGYELQSVSDEVLQNTIKKLAKRKESLEKIDEDLKEALDIQSKRGKISKAIARTLHTIVPQGWYQRLPSRVARYFAEEGDILEYLETLQRDNVNNIQLEVRILAACAHAKRDEMDQLEQDLKRAEQENWSAKRLQSFMAKRANITIYKEVATLLDVEFKTLSDEQKEERKQYLLQKLRAQVELGYELITTMSKVCAGSLQVFHTAVAQYADFTNVIRPIQRIRNIAQALTDTNTAMYAAPDAIRETFKASVRAITAAMDAARQVEKYSLSSGNLKSLLKSGRAELDNSRLEFKPDSGEQEPSAEASEK